MGPLLLVLLPGTAPAAGLAAGTVGAQCRADEKGLAIEVDVRGLKDRTGTLRLELYRDNAADFLADDTKLRRRAKPSAG